MAAAAEPNLAGGRATGAEGARGERGVGGDGHHAEGVGTGVAAPNTQAAAGIVAPGIGAGIDHDGAVELIVGVRIVDLDPEDALAVIFDRVGNQGDPAFVGVAQDEDRRGRPGPR